MQEQIDLVVKFAQKYNIKHATEPSAAGSQDEIDTRKFLLKKMTDEVLEAIDSRDIVQIALKLGNLQFVIFGTACVFGLKRYFPQIFTEIWKSNMTRSLAKDSNGKVIKGDGFRDPDITSILSSKS